jgi:hypothetical protein
MGVWSIGKIRGRFQPEDFTETQGMEVKDMKLWGTVTRVMFSGWNPREITLSFVVDSVHKNQEDEEKWSMTYSAPEVGGGFSEKTISRERSCPIYDPERVWDYIQELQRPASAAGKMDPIPVVMPGWGDRGEQLKYVYITSASIKRTHIKADSESGGNTRAVRATITLTMKEAVFFETEKEAEAAKQTMVR